MANNNNNNNNNNLSIQQQVAITTANTSCPRLIVVVGATGNQGGSVVNHLLERNEKCEEDQDLWKIRGLTRKLDSEKVKVSLLVILVDIIIFFEKII